MMSQKTHQCEALAIKSHEWIYDPERSEFDYRSDSFERGGWNLLSDVNCDAGLHMRRGFCYGCGVRLCADGHIGGRYGTQTLFAEHPELIPLLPEMRKKAIDAVGNVKMRIECHEGYGKEVEPYMHVAFFVLEMQEQEYHCLMRKIVEEEGRRLKQEVANEEPPREVRVDPTRWPKEFYKWWYSTGYALGRRQNNHSVSFFHASDYDRLWGERTRGRGIKQKSSF